MKVLWAKSQSGWDVLDLKPRGLGALILGVGVSRTFGRYVSGLE